MSQLKKHVGYVSFGLVLGIAQWTFADADADALAKAPAAVQATAQHYLKGNSMEGFDLETVNGKTVYEVTYKVHGVEYASTINEAGVVIEQEMDVDPVAVPSAVMDVAMKAHAGGTVVETGIITEGAKMFYEVEIKAADVVHAMKINADGSVIADAIAAPEADSKEAAKDEEKDKEEGHGHHEGHDGHEGHEGHDKHGEKKD